MKVLLVSSHGDPKNTKLWSGTPANLWKALEDRQVVNIETLFVLKYKFIDRILILTEILFRLGRRRSVLRKFVTTKLLWITLRNKLSNYSHILFFDLEANPRVLMKTKQDTQFYLLLDSTQVQWELVNAHITPSSKNQLKKRRANDKRILSNFNGYFVLTQATRESLLKDYHIESQKICLVRTGTGQAIDKIIPPKIENVANFSNLLTIAKGEHWRKGIDLLLEAFRLDFLNGNFELRALLGDKFWEPIPHRVQTFGYISLVEMKAIFENADIFVLPCRFEPYGLVFIEAVRMGLPIVTTINSGLGYEFVNLGWPGAIVDLDAKSIAQGILNLGNAEASNLEALVKLQSEILESFSWPKMADAMLIEWRLISS